MGVCGDVLMAIGARVCCASEGVLLVMCWVVGRARAYLLREKMWAVVEAASPM